MKIRLGFVSNSSASSFLIYGAELEDSDLPKDRVKTNEDGDMVDEDGELDGDGTYEIWEDISEKYKLDCHIPDDSGCYYLGLSWDKVKDDETGKEFKKRVEVLLEKALGKKVKCRTYEEAWNG